jgi:hypothetical protein
VTPDGRLFKQVDGVSMGSSLGPTFANYYMGKLEERILNVIVPKPIVYCRYVDDIFIACNGVEEIIELKTKFETNSCLKFTYETDIGGNLHFLDVNIDKKNDGYTTSVYAKDTNTGDCLNFRSICPERYKIGVIKTFLHRAYNICSTWEGFVREVENIKQCLVNNNFPMHVLDSTIAKFMNSIFERKCSPNIIENETIPLFYMNQMSSNYKQREDQLKKIIKNYVKPKDAKSVNVLIYYKSRKLRNILIQNSPKNVAHVNCSNVVYQYECPNTSCNASSYIGYTTNTLKTRMGQHSNNGSIKQHGLGKHETRLTSTDILNCTKVLSRCRLRSELIILEALYIKSVKPDINQQNEGAHRVLKIF